MRAPARRCGFAWHPAPPAGAGPGETAARHRPDAALSRRCWRSRACTSLVITQALRWRSTVSTADRATQLGARTAVGHPRPHGETNGAAGAKRAGHRPPGRRPAKHLAVGLVAEFSGANNVGNGAVGGANLLCFQGAGGALRVRHRRTASNRRGQARWAECRCAGGGRSGGRFTLCHNACRAPNKSGPTAPGASSQAASRHGAATPCCRVNGEHRQGGVNAACWRMAGLREARSVGAAAL